MTEIEEIKNYTSIKFSELRVPAVVVKKLKERGVPEPDSFLSWVIEKLGSKFNLFASSPERVESTSYGIAIGLIRKSEKRFSNAQSICIVPTEHYARRIIDIAVDIKPDEITVLSALDPDEVTGPVKEHIVVGTPEFLTRLIEKGAIDLGHIHLCIVYNTHELLVNGGDGSYLRLLTLLKRFTAKRYAFFSPEITKEFMEIFREIGITEIKKVVGLHMEPLSVFHYAVPCDDSLENKTQVLVNIVRRMENKQGLLFTESPATGDDITKFFLEHRVPAVNIASASVTDESAADVRERFNSLRAQILVCTYDKIYRLEGVLGVAIAINFDAPKGYLTYGRVVERVTRFSPYGVIVTITLPKEKCTISRIGAELGCTINYELPDKVAFPISLANPKARVSQICSLISNFV